MPNTSDAERTRKLVLDQDRVVAVTGRQSEHVRRCVEALATGLPSARVRAYSAESLTTSLRSGEDQIGVIIAADAIVEAAEVGSRHGVPVLSAADVDPERMADALPGARVTAETLLCVRPAHRPVRFVLAECIVEPLAGGSLRVEGDHGLDAVVPMLRAVNRDPFGLLPEVRCAHDASSMVGLCWTGAEPLADRMIHRRSRVVVTGLDSPGVNVICDSGRFRLHTTRLTIGPAQRLRVVHI